MFNILLHFPTTIKLREICDFLKAKIYFSKVIHLKALISFTETSKKCSHILNKIKNICFEFIHGISCCLYSFIYYETLFPEKVSNYHISLITNYVKY